MPAVTINLDKGESIYTQSGGMTWMTSDISMETNMEVTILLQNIYKTLIKDIKTESLAHKEICA